MRWIQMIQIMIFIMTDADRRHTSTLVNKLFENQVLSCTCAAVSKRSIWLILLRVHLCWSAFFWDPSGFNPAAYIQVVSLTAPVRSGRHPIGGGLIGRPPWFLIIDEVCDTIWGLVSRNRRRVFLTICKACTVLYQPLSIKMNPTNTTVITITDACVWHGHTYHGDSHTTTEFSCPISRNGR